MTSVGDSSARAVWALEHRLPSIHTQVTAKAFSSLSCLCRCFVKIFFVFVVLLLLLVVVIVGAVMSIAVLLFIVFLIVVLALTEELVISHTSHDPR